jgi:hypothetical protein
MKVFNQKCGVGSAKYVVNYHNGEKFHSDNSKFFDMKLFTNQKLVKLFIKQLIKDGYKQQ